MARRAGFVAVVVALGGFAWLSIQVYRSTVVPEAFEAWDGPHAWVVGPSAEALNGAARRHLDEALRHLSDPSRSAGERIEAYRESLGAAEDLLVRSLRAHPAQAWALAKVAAIRWELDPPITQAGLEQHMAIIELASEMAPNDPDVLELASEMAPNDPDVQVDLGKLLLLTGRRDEGATYLRRAVELSPEMADPVVALMRRFFFTPDEMLATLPRSSATMASLRGPFLEAGLAGEYAARLDREVRRGVADATLMRTFGETCIPAGEPRMLLDALESIGASTDPPTEAERLLQVAWARLELGDAATALEDAGRARDLQPEIERYHGQLGLIAMRAGQPEVAESAFRRALALAVRSSVTDERRGTLYRRIGHSLDAQGRADQAYDTYKQALALSPQDPHARRRVQEMEEAAGVRR
jgi:tetratricopeptide (TPR) repeat protein